jgi:hypothetical protein
VLRNAMVPVLTVMGLQFANLLTGTIVVENVFVPCPASGAWCSRRSPTATWCVVRNVVMLLAAMVVLVNFAVDVLYAVIDPRLQGAPMTAAHPGPAALGSARLRHPSLWRRRRAGGAAAGRRRAVAGVDTPYPPAEIDMAASCAPPGGRALAGHRQPGPRHRLAAAGGRAQNCMAVGGGGGHRPGVGVALGLLAAARRGWVEELVMRLADFSFAFPALLTAIMLTAAWGRGWSPHRGHRHLQHPGVCPHRARRGARGVVARIRAGGARLRQGAAGASRWTMCCPTSPAC